METSKKTILTRIAINVGIVLVFFVVVLLFRSRINSIVENIISTRTALGARSASLKSFVQLKSEYDGKGQAYLNVLHNFIPSRDQLLSLSKEFQLLAGQQNLGYGFSLLTETPAGPEQLGSLGFRLNISGRSFDDLFIFIQKLEAFHYLTSIDGIDISGGTSGASMVVSGKVYFRQ